MPYCHRPWVWFPRCHRGASCALPKTGHVQRRGRDQSAAQCGFHRGRVGDPPEVLAGTFFFVSIFIPKEPWNPWDTHSGVIISYCREKSVICSTIRLLAKDMQLTALKVATWLSWMGYADSGFVAGFCGTVEEFPHLPLMAQIDSSWWTANHTGARLWSMEKSSRYILLAGVHVFT